jgi:hypothetical protein
MKKPTLIVATFFAGYVHLGCSIGYFAHKHTVHNNELRLNKEIQQQAKDIFNTPDLTKNPNINIEQKHEIPATSPLYRANAPGWLYNYRSTNHQ